MQVENSPRNGKVPGFGRAGCLDHQRHLEHFGAAVRELLELHEQQWLAIIDGDGESYRFDLLIHMANEKKQAAKYAYLRHVEAHGCSDFDALNQIGTRSHHR